MLKQYQMGIEHNLKGDIFLYIPVYIMLYTMKRGNWKSVGAMGTGNIGISFDKKIPMSIWPSNLLMTYYKPNIFR